MNSNLYQGGIILENKSNINNDCPFCLERDGGSYKSYNKDLQCKFDLRIVKPKGLGDVMVFPDLSPLKYGHILVCTCDHIVNFGKIQKSSTVMNIEKVMTELSYHLGESSEWLFFEHGTSSCISKNGCVQHTHAHVVPVTSGTYEKIVTQSCEYGDQSELEFSSLLELHHGLSKMTDREHYVLFGRCTSGKSLSARYIKSDFIPSQLMRYMLSEILRISMHIDEIPKRNYEFDKTMELLRTCFRQ